MHIQNRIQLALDRGRSIAADGGITTPGGCAVLSWHRGAAAWRLPFRGSRTIEAPERQPVVVRAPVDRLPLLHPCGGMIVLADNAAAEHRGEETGIQERRTRYPVAAAS